MAGTAIFKLNKSACFRYIKYDKNEYKEICVYMFEEDYDIFKEKVTRKYYKLIISLISLISSIGRALDF